MIITKAILSGVIMWFLVFMSFILLSFIPEINNSQIYQEIIIGVLTVPSALLGAIIYYKNGINTNGLIIGTTMLSVALILDAIITVPLIEIPYNGSSYLEFFTNPFLWIIALEIIAAVYFYWRFKVEPKF